jgi:hypothetical protein
MNIFAKEGDKVIYSILQEYNSDKETAEKYLTRGNIYTVDYTHVEDFHTDVYLKEIPKISFNSVLFADYIPKADINKLIDYYISAINNNDCFTKDKFKIKILNHITDSSDVEELRNISRRLL